MAAQLNLEFVKSVFVRHLFQGGNSMDLVILYWGMLKLKVDKRSWWPSLISLFEIWGGSGLCHYQFRGQH